MASIEVERIITAQNEIVYIDLNDVLDILEDKSGDKLYIIVFNDGSIYYKVKMNKSVYNKFVKLKKKRGQKNETMFNAK